MRLPIIPAENTQRDLIDVFGGYNHNQRINDNEFYDMQNLTSDSYPLLSTRTHRGNIPSGAKKSNTEFEDRGMLWMNGLYYIYIDPVSTGTNSNNDPLYHIYICGPYTTVQGHTYVDYLAGWTTIDKTTKRTLISMGAKIIILPDKKILNTANITAPSTTSTYLENIENHNRSGGTVSIQPCDGEGNVLSIDYVGDDEPDGPPDGYVWLDTSFSPASLKKYYAASGIWQSFISTRVKISDTSNTISDGFSVGDGIRISGIADADLSALNATCIVRSIPDTKSLVVTGSVESMKDKSILTAAHSKSGTSILFYCDSTVSLNKFAGKSMKIAGNNEVTCTENTDCEQVHYALEIGGDNLTSSSATLTTTSTTQSGSKIFISETLDIDIRGRMVVFGSISDYIVATILSWQNVQGTGAYIIVNADLDSIAAGTVISPVTTYKPDNLYKTTLTFSEAVKVLAGDKACPALDAQYTQVYDAQHADETAVKFDRTMPEMDFVCEAQNRLWGCKYGLNADSNFVNEIYCSKLGDEKNWEVYDGTVSTNSYRATVGSSGSWTGAANYRGSPVFFKENHIHTVLGNYPYQITDTEARGVQAGSSGSLAMVNEVLFYKSRHGICAYTGGLPADISQHLGGATYTEAVGCAFKGKYYVCMKHNGEPSFFVYDIDKGMWHKEDDLYVDDFVVTDNDVYFIRNTGSSYVTGSLFGGQESTPIRWYAESGLMGLSSVDKKYISRINLRLMLLIGSAVFVSIEYDSSGEWEQVCNVVGHSTMPFTLPIKPRRCDHFRLRLEGIGDMKLFSLSKTIEQGSDY